MSGGSRIVPGSGPAETPRVDARAKLGPETLARICTRIAGGMPKAHACAKEGVSRQALYQLASRDPEVAAMLEDASDEGAEFYREQVMSAPDDWKRWAWLAERLHPDTFGPPKQRVEKTGADGGPQQVEHSGAVTITLEDAKRIAREGGK